MQSVEEAPPATQETPRVLVLAQTDAPLDGDGLPVSLHSVAVVILTEQVRVDAADTHRVLPQAGRRAEGDFRGQPAHRWGSSRTRGYAGCGPSY